MIDMFICIARCIIGVSQYISNLRGKVAKYDSTCVIESKISFRYFSTNLSAINQFAFFVQLFTEITVADSTVFS